jgi:hypothetical protein
MAIFKIFLFILIIHMYTRTYKSLYVLDMIIFGAPQITTLPNVPQSYKTA